MGGKRPDQYQIDPGEAGATDYKSLPQTGRGNSNLDDTVELDHQRVAEARAEEERTPAPNYRPAPSEDANRPLRADEAERELIDETGAHDADSDEGNPLV